MKNMRKIASVLLALVMVFALAAPVFAAENYTITINNEATGHTYEAYQIFKGDLSGSTLSNIQWGASVDNAEDLANAANIAERLDENYEGEETPLTLDNLLTMIDLGDEAYASTSTQTDGKYVMTVDQAGYYLIKDKVGSLNGKEDTYTEYIIKVVKDVDAAPKGVGPTVVKKVQDINDSTGEVSGWQDSADYDIGDSVPFQLTATLASNVEAYSTYKVVFHDTLSAGLTFDEGSVEVTFNGEKVNDYFTIDCKDGKLTISCDDVKEFGATNDSVIVVEYTAELNENANIGAAGNPNFVYLEYSNNPNWNGSGEPGTPGTPEGPGGEEPEEPTGKTPEDKVIVFTYKFVVDKVDENKNPLEGAGFTLFKLDAVSGEYVAIGDELKVDENENELTTFAWTGLDDGSYKLVETTTPAGYNTIAPIEFTIVADHDTTWEAEDRTEILIELTGNKYTGDVETGEYKTQVENKSGVQLPETGGIGTTMFYIFGAVMVLGAAVLLVTKKRMSIAE